MPRRSFTIGTYGTQEARMAPLTKNRAETAHRDAVSRTSVATCIGHHRHREWCANGCTSGRTGTCEAAAPARCEASLPESENAVRQRSSVLRAHAVPRVRLARCLRSQRVDRRARGEEERPEIGPAEGQVGRDLRRADDPEPAAVRREDPRAARAGAIDPALDVHLHAVRNAVGFV